MATISTTQKTIMAEARKGDIFFSWKMIFSGKSLYNLQDA
jgi:hypothetical protein